MIAPFPGQAAPWPPSILVFKAYRIRQAFRFAYIDAFAGTSYRTQKSSEVQGELLFPEFADKETRRFLEGSVRIALQVTPRFNKYIFRIAI